MKIIMNTSMQFYRRSNLIYYRFHITFIRYLFLIVNRAYKKKRVSYLRSEV